MNHYNPYKTASFNMTEMYLAWIMFKATVDAEGMNAPLDRINAVNRLYGDLHEKDEQIRGALKGLTGTAVITLLRDTDLTLFKKGIHEADVKSNPVKKKD